MNDKNPTSEQLERRRRKLEIYKHELAKLVYDENGIEPASLEYSGRSKDFLIVPDEITFSGKHLSHGELRLWQVIFSHNRKTDPAFRVSWPGRERLAVVMGVKSRQISGLLEGLRRKGLLLTKKRLGLTSAYILKDPPRSWLLEMHRKLKAQSLEKKRNLQTIREEGLNRLLSGMPSVKQSNEIIEHGLEDDLNKDLRTALAVKNLS